MTDLDDVRALRDLLERATDRVDNPHLAARALAAARRRRVVGRGVAVGGVAAAVAAIAVGVATTRPDAGPPPGPSLPATAPSTPAPSDPPTTAPSDPPTVDPGIVQPRWDPRDVDDLPTAEALPGLPFDITSPDSATPLTESPLESAVLTASDRDDILVMASDGQWRSVPAARWASGSLSPSGTKLSVALDNGVEIWDLPTGERTEFDDPAGFEPWDFSTAVWVDDDTLLLDDMAGGWLVDATTGAATRVPYPAQPPYWWTLDPNGAVVESADFHLPAVLTDWAGREPVEIPMTGTGRLMRPAASDDAIAATTYEGGDGDSYRAVVADRDDLTPRAVLPLLDPAGNYSNGGLSTVAVLDDGSVLLRVAIIGRSLPQGLRLVRWSPKAGSLEVVARMDVGPTVGFSYARDAFS